MVVRVRSETKTKLVHCFGWKLNWKRKIFMFLVIQPNAKAADCFAWTKGNSPIFNNSCSSVVASYLVFLSIDEWSDEGSEENSSTQDDDGAIEPDEDSTSGTASESRRPKKQHKIANVAAKRKSHLNIVFIGHVGKFMSSPLYGFCHWQNVCSSLDKG